MSTDAQKDSTTLDHIEGFIVPGNAFVEPKNEYWALLCLWEGMEFLYRQARRADETVLNRIGENVEYFGMGNSPLYRDLPLAMLTVSFHWYAVSACNYVRTVGAIACREGLSGELPQKYAESVIPEVTAFRDKVAAHFAWATKNRHDNEAERSVSVMPALTFENESFHVGGMTLSLRQGENSSTSKAIGPWSLSKVHERLRKRYWPQLSSDGTADTNPTSA